MRTTPTTADTLRAMVTGLRVAQMVHVVAKLGIADLLESGPKSCDELAAATGAHAPSLYRLLRGLGSLGLFTEGADQQFALTPLGDHLRTGASESLRDLAIFWSEDWHWRLWGELLQSVQTGEPATRRLWGMELFEYLGQNPEASAGFDRAMTGSYLERNAALLSTFDFSGIGTLVDVGGGHGRLLAAILARNPAMRGILFDRPEVVAGAQEVLRAADVADRCERVGGSCFESVPEGGDVYLLAAVIHSWDDAEAAVVLRNCGRAMGPRSRLLVVEHVIPPRDESHRGKLTDVEMLLVGGRERTEPEFRALLDSAGFRLTRIVPTGAPHSVIEAVRR
jgi:SAM-dependent methyltransferase